MKEHLQGDCLMSPALSKSQRKAAAIAKHHPEILYHENKGFLDMTQKDLSKLAGTKEKGLPKKKGKK